MDFEVGLVSRFIFQFIQFLTFFCGFFGISWVQWVMSLVVVYLVFFAILFFQVEGDAVCLFFGVEQVDVECDKEFSCFSDSGFLVGDEGVGVKVGCLFSLFKLWGELFWGGCFIWEGVFLELGRGKKDGIYFCRVYFQICLFLVGIQYFFSKGFIFFSSDGWQGSAIGRSCCFVVEVYCKGGLLVRFLVSGRFRNFIFRGEIRRFNLVSRSFGVVFSWFLFYGERFFFCVAWDRCGWWLMDIFDGLGFLFCCFFCIDVLKKSLL